jgi:hypothetical protein
MSPLFPGLSSLVIDEVGDADTVLRMRARTTTRRQARGFTPSTPDEQQRHQRKTSRVLRPPQRDRDGESRPSGYLESPATRGIRSVRPSGRKFACHSAGP